ncbi:MAG: nitrogenase component 1 [Syntrophomonadaceae bacterium]|jgi:nitrogenase iron protein NifH
MKQIAIYGKGGIGKSTIAAHLSAALSQLGLKVMQVGCDPKHDSTRLLTGGRDIVTVLDYIKSTSPDRWKSEDIVVPGFGGVWCVEAGGPEPGVGCAGRGILTTFDLLKRLGIMDESLDVVIYDVLGDVVCGGFAVPLRQEYANEVYIVTSGEFMSLYAANNILRGLQNYEGLPRLGGLIFNHKGLAAEEQRVARFAAAVSLPICAIIPRSDDFAVAEQKACTLFESSHSTLDSLFAGLAERMMGEHSLYPALPLQPERLEEMVLRRPQTQRSRSIRKHTGVTDKAPYMAEPGAAPLLSLNVRRREPLHGCAFNGAVNVAVQVQDAITVAHGPRSCAHFSYQTITSAARKSLFERGVALPVQIIPPLLSSDMSEGRMIFGGIKELRQQLMEIKKDLPAAIFVATTCPAGIIGDNLEQIMDLDDPTGTRLIPLPVDGNISGDYLQGMISAYADIARGLMRTDLKAEPDLVNIIAEKTIASVTERNLETISELLGQIGVSVNCRFICRTTVEEIANFNKAGLNLLAYDDYMGLMMRDFLKETFQARFFDDAFPTGFTETAGWLRKLAAFFGRAERVDDIVNRHQEAYRTGIEKLRPTLKGKRLMVVTYNHDIDWILEPALDLGMEIVQVGILNYSQDNRFRSRFLGQFPLIEKYPQERRLEDIEARQPDIFLSNHALSNFASPVFTDVIPLCPPVGFFSGLELAQRWTQIFRNNINEGWKKDEALFRKYLA